MSDFVERHGLWSDDQRSSALELERRLGGEEFDVVRFAYPDQHGILRGKTLVVAEARRALRSGVSLTSTLLFKDTSHRTVYPVFSKDPSGQLQGLVGGADIMLVADPTTFRSLPWARRTGWVLCDPYVASGQPCSFGTRQILQRALHRLEERELRFTAGLEVEFHVFRLEDPRMRLEHSGQPGEPPTVSLLTHGHQYLTEVRYDRADALMELLRAQLMALDLPLRSLEIEFGPSQFELTFGPTTGTTPADTMVLLRSAIKQICHREGLHATFMCRPAIPNVMSSGWHLHQSLTRRSDGANAFMPAGAESTGLSALGMQWLAGLKTHARGTAALASPTVNGYRRYRPMSLAPDRATWGRDNRGAMLRVIGGPDDQGSRIENRIGEPTANPYLYLASQVFSGLDGITRGLDPGPSTDAPYDTPADSLPRSLGEALILLEKDEFLRECLGPAFVDYYVHIKRAELARFELEVTQWEQREYFDLF